MSDYTTQNTSGGSSTKGLVIALVVIVLFIVGLATLGSNSTGESGATAPAAGDTTTTEPAATGATTGTVTE